MTSSPTIITVENQSGYPDCYVNTFWMIMDLLPDKLGAKMYTVKGKNYITIGVNNKLHIVAS